MSIIDFSLLDPPCREEKKRLRIASRASASMTESVNETATAACRSHAAAGRRRREIANGEVADSGVGSKALSAALLFSSGHDDRPRKVDICGAGSAPETD
jgi:hypothetical protein